jgi:hypothetical protein
MVRTAGRLMALMALLGAASEIASAGEFVTGWQKPRGKTEYDFRVLMSECKKKASAAHPGNSAQAALLRQASYEACGQANGAIMQYRSLDGQPADGPMSAEDLKKRRRN